MEIPRIRVQPVKFILYNSCLNCDNRWRTFNPEFYPDYPKCLDCNTRDTEYKVVYPEYYDEIKCKGFYNCHICKNEWTSNNTWIFYKQRCLKCDIYIYYNSCQEFQTTDFYGLLRNKPNRKKHHIENCEYCYELGRSCIRVLGNDSHYYP